MPRNGESRDYNLLSPNYDCCRGAFLISGRYAYWSYKSRSFEILRDLLRQDCNGFHSIMASPVDVGWQYVCFIGRRECIDHSRECLHIKHVNQTQVFLSRNSYAWYWNSEVAMLTKKKLIRNFSLTCTCEIALSWISLDVTGEKSTLIQVMNVKQ